MLKKTFFEIPMKSYSPRLKLHIKYQSTLKRT